MRRRLVSWGLIAALLIGGLGAGLTWYLNRVFLPGPARQWIATWLAEQTGRKIQLGQLTFGLWDGVAIDHVIIFDDRRDGQSPCLELDRITFSCLYLPLLKERRFIIPAVRLVHPRIHLARDAAGVWNTQSMRFLHRRAPGPTATAPVTVVILRGAIVDGELLVEDALAKPGLDATLTHINLRAMLNLPQTLSWKGTAQWQTVPVTPLLVHGRWDVRKRAGDLALTARQFPLETARPYLPPAIAAALRTLAGTATVTLRARGRPEHVRLTAAAATHGLRWQWRALQGGGDISVTAHGGWQPKAAAPWTGRRVAVHLQHLTLAPPAPWPTIEHLVGAVAITPDGANAEDLSATLNGVPVRARGTLHQRHLAAEVVCDAPLEVLWRAIEPYRTGWLAETSLEGTGQCRVVVNGPWRTPHLAAHLTLTDARVTHPATGPMDHVSGRWLIEPNLLTATEVRGTWREQPIQLEGTLVNFAAPEIDGRLQWGEFAAEVACAVQGSRVTLSNVTATYRHSRLQTTGEFTMGRDLDGIVHGDATLDLADLASRFPAAAQLQAWRPLGTIHAQGVVRGPLRTPRAWECQVVGRAREVMVRGIRLNNVQGEYRQRDGVATMPALTALGYGGTLSASGSLDLNRPHQPMAVDLGIHQVELGRLMKDTPWRDRPISGQTELEARVRGLADALPRSLEGQGRIQVVNGQLFEIPVLRGLADLLGAPALRRVTFRDAAGNFTLEREVLSTEDLTFYSNVATLTAAGSLGLRGAINAHVVTSIDPTAFEHAPQVVRAAGALLHQAGYLVGEVRISGTVSEPRYEVVPVPLSRVVKEQLLERLRGALGEIVR